MHTAIRILSLFLLLPLVACNSDSDTTAPAPSAGQFQPGIDYELLPAAVPTVDPAKIEVTEIFWYGCPHCYTLEPLVAEWFPTLGDDVVLNRLPAIWHPSMEPHARMFYANQALGIEDQLHQPLFDALNREGLQLTAEEEILDWVEEQGIDRETYRRAFNSFGVTSQVGQVQAKMAQYRVRGTPELVVNGKYHVTTTMAKTQENMLVIASSLIEKERAERGN